ncbi:glycoside hydrolase family 10 protein [Oscillatoria sp. FACHB-1407]|nr:glycoside hydrolase family 10 protein [Oscillatoria sp. FACHB-1407]
MVVLLCMALIQAMSSPRSVPIANQSTEVRGVWLTNVGSGVLFAPWGVERALNQLARLNFNTVYPVVWNRGHTFYPSATAQRIIGRSQDPWLNTLRLGGDVLSTIVKQGNRQGLRVIPWFEYGFMAPAQSTLVYRHPEWLTQRQNGTKTLELHEHEQTLLTPTQNQLDQQQLRREIYSRLVGDRVWLNPLHPEVQQFLLDLITEVVTQYDIDGIQLDDHFGFPVEFGYDPYTVNLYQQEHNGAKPPNDPLNAEWMQWRANRLTAFMGRIFETVKALDPNCIVSLSPNPQAFSYHAYLQDWQTWVNRGWVEELVVQVYRNDLSSFQAVLAQPSIRAAQQRIPVAIAILTGSWRRPITFRQIRQQVEAVRKADLNGVSFFYWETLWSYLTPESPKERRANFQTLFAKP